MSTKAPFHDPSDLPSDLPGCHAMIKDLRAEVDRLTKIAETVTLLQERVLDLENQIKQKTRARFGRSSAQVKTTSLTGTGRVVYEQSAKELTQHTKELRPIQNKRRGGGRTAPGNALLERTVEHEIIELDKRLCPCCGEVRRKIGFDVTGYEGDIKNLKLLDHPVILHVVVDGKQQHYVVCYNYENEKFTIGDPAWGITYYSESELAAIWQSKALLSLSPNQNFQILMNIGAMSF